MRRLFAKILFIAFGMLVVGVIGVDNVSAKVISDDKLYSLSVFQGVYDCYDTYANSEIKKGVFDQSFYSTGGKGYGITTVFKTSDWTNSENILTTSIGNSLSGKKSYLDCAQLLNGSGETNFARSLRELYGLPSTLKGWGYAFDHVEGGGASGEATKVTIKLNSIKDHSQTNTKTPSVSSNLELEMQYENSGWSVVGIVGKKGSMEASYVDNAGKEHKIGFEFGRNGGDNGPLIVRDMGYKDSCPEGATWDEDTRMCIDSNGFGTYSISVWAGINGNDTLTNAFQEKMAGKKDDIESAVSNSSLITELKKAFGTYFEDYFPNPYVVFTVTSVGNVDVSQQDLESSDAVYVLPSGSKGIAASDMLINVGVNADDYPHLTSTKGGKTSNLYYWNTDYVYSLYYRYLQKMLEKYSNMTIEDCGERGQSKYALKTKADVWCQINIEGEADEILNEPLAINGTSSLTMGTFGSVLDWLSNEKSYDGLSEDIYSDIAKDEEEEDDGGGDTEEPTCANSGGAQKLGWIVCSIMEWLGTAAQDAYEDFVEPSLRVEPQLFSGGNEGVRTAWETFRNIANIAFIILFLVVIFSQLTGVGIDNYGIKKILPKLIVVAILINLSYILCIVFVDLSNILGNALRALFDSLGSGLTPTLEIPEATVKSEAIGSTVLTGVAILGALVIMVGTIWRNPAIVLSILVAALGVAISIFFLFVLLAIREAAIVVLVAISPLAVMCYALPNTKKLFDKWWKFFEGLLLVYPICGLLVGGGNYVSNLLLSVNFAGGGFLKALTAMIVGIVPIFFIPTVLKGSFAAMGKVGGMLTGMGDRARKGATSRARGSEVYKNAQSMGLERRNRIRAGINREGQLTARGERKAKRAKFFGSAATRRQAARVQQAKKTIGEAEAANAALTGALAASGIAAASTLDTAGIEGLSSLADLGDTTNEQNYYYRQFLESASKGSTSGMNAAIQAMKSSNLKDKDIAKVVRFAINQGLMGGMSREQKDQWMRETAKAYGNDFLASDFELNHYMRSGGWKDKVTGQDIALGDYGNYAMNKPIEPDEYKPEDLIKLSGDSLAGMAAAGKISTTMAQRVMAMNPNISEDKKIMFGALASGAATAAKITDGGKVSLGDAAKNFKSDAEALMKKGVAANNTIRNDDGSSVSGEMVEAWASATPQSVNVVQNFRGGGQQYAPVETSASLRPERIERAEYENISGKSTMKLTRMSDGTLRDDSGNVYDQGRWKKKT
ncbi:MAG: MFS transporter [Candidatus Saccharibacteria bacterium]|nr:MFS transporter [Candidatus Saccharibacteria bacterium]